jgi:heterogeneous nuclear ribonucleoprotein R
MRGKGDNKTYAFINFRTKEMALKAIRKLCNKDLKVCLHNFT